jgi:hypothetical protein
MFTLGNKEAIVNSPDQYPFLPAAATVGAVLNIKGFGTFDPTKIVSGVARRASLGTLEKLNVTAPTAAELGIIAGEVGVPVVVHLRVNSLRQASESAIDFIKRGRPMILEIRVDSGDTAADIAATTFASFEEYKNKFNNITLPLTAAYTPGNTYIDFTAAEPWFQILENVTYLKRGDIFALNAVTTKLYANTTVNDAGIAFPDDTITLTSVATLKVNDSIVFAGSPTIYRKITDIIGNAIVFTPAAQVGEVANGQAVSLWTVGVEAVNDGKYLEENVRMSTPFTSDAYAIKPGEVPIIGAKYTMISFVVDQTDSVGSWQPHKAAGAVANAIPAPRYTLYFNETTGLGGGGQIALLLAWLDFSGDFNFPDMKKANGASATSIADFIA